MVGFPSLIPPEQAATGSQCGACPADCLEACFNDAIVAVAGEGVQIQAADCAGCGACIPACEFGFIRLQGGVARIVFPNDRPGTPEIGAPNPVSP
jgi:Fe-S-cluster-containing hydrogenase component 2